MNIDKEILTIYGYIVASKYRTRIMNALNKDAPKMPSEISNETGIIMNHVSNSLKELQEYGVITCLNPSFRKGRLYALTSKGEKVQELLNKKTRYVLTNDGIKDTNTDKMYCTLEEIVELLNEQ